MTVRTQAARRFLRVVRRRRSACVLLLVALAVTGCASEREILPVANEFGPEPRLAAPEATLLPTVNPARAIGWSDSESPEPMKGLSVSRFASGLNHPRWLYVLPNGDVVVAETNKPRTQGGFTGIKGWVAKQIMAYAGADAESTDRLTLLRDADKDGIAEQRFVFASGLSSPFGMALVGDHFYVANAASLWRFDYRPGATALTAKTVLTALPGAERNHHWTKSLLADPSGTELYVGVGSNSNIAEHGMAAEHHRAAILKYDLVTGALTPFATGLRNPVGMAWHTATQSLWTVVNERDELGDQLVPDYLTRVEEGAFYGWPYSYWGDVVDTRVNPQNPSLVAKARKPDFALGAHTASLGLAFYSPTPESASSCASSPIAALGNHAIIGQHGSWNRAQPSGYKVIAVPFVSGKPQGKPITVLDGFLNAEGEARGRPVGVAVDPCGGILVADDTGNSVWRINP